jgi:uncharacterized protein YndB with AHSA1/START domain
MKIELTPDKSVDDATCLADTGKRMAQWFALMDAFGGLAKGRRDLGNFLYKDHSLDPWWGATLNIAYEDHHGQKEKDGRARGFTICATKSIKATAEVCFAQFASAKALDAWLGPRHALDFREGGELKNADGNRATLKKITPGKTIKLVWEQAGVAEDTPVEIKFPSAGGKTTVTITHDRLQDRAAADGMRRAWGEALGKLKQRLES